MASAAAAGAGPAEVQVPAMLAVLCLSTCTGLVTELANWFLVYSTETYRHGRTTVERLQRTLADARREAAGARAGADKKRAKRLKALEADLSRATLNLNKGRSQGFALVQSLLFMGLAWTLGSVLKGVVVAKIPFEPPAIFTKMTHRLIEGDDMTDCAYAAIYMLAGMAIKPSITRLLSFGVRQVGQNQNPFAQGMSMAQAQK
jgi:uncharacterized membrane protein (DUF106 family)